MNKDIKILIGVDVDAVAGWLGSYGGQDSPSDIQRGVFAGEIGTPRLLELFQRFGITTTWFIPGHSIEAFPREMTAVVEQGHEVGAHGYSHENPVQMSLEQEREVLSRCVELVTRLAGRQPLGYVAPWWEMSRHTASLLIEHGFSYDHSQNYNDFHPFYARIGDEWTKIDYSRDATDWMEPLRHGHEVDLVEFCGNWYLDDLPPMMFIKQLPNSHGFVNPRQVEELWQDQFEWVYREFDYAVFPVTLHPDVSGRPQVLLMLERLFSDWLSRPGVSFTTFESAAADFRRRYPFDLPNRPVPLGPPHRNDAAQPGV